MNRAPWHEYFMLLAKMVALRSGCNSRPSGAVIVKDKRILATGYNGPMPGAWHCTDRGPGYCFRREKGIPDIDKYNFCRATHAEANAIAQAARFGISVEGADLYCTLAPCYVCLKLIASAGIKAVYYEYDYGSRDFERDAFWKEAIKEAGLVEFRQIKVSEEVLRQVQEILPYPTSKRRLPPTEFLEKFEDGETYRLPAAEVLKNKLRYQTGLDSLSEIRFIIERATTEKLPEEETSFFLVGERSGFSSTCEEIYEALSRDERKELVLKIDSLEVPVSFIREAEGVRLLVHLPAIDQKHFEKVLFFLDYLAYQLSHRLTLPFKLEFRLKALFLKT